MTCGTGAAPDICPDLDQCHGVLMALQPRGRAWDTRPGGVRWRFWRALAHLFAFMNARICAAMEEAFCASMVETRPEWLADYGLPDPCDPYGEICAKVRGGERSRCADIVAVAARAGWSVACIPNGFCGAQAGGAFAGGDQTGGPGGASIRIVVVLSASPAFHGSFDPASQAGCLQAGGYLACEPDLSALFCLLGRVIQAHVEPIYEVVA
jgi:hypothetical protein